MASGATTALSFESRASVRAASDAAKAHALRLSSQTVCASSARFTKSTQMRSVTVAIQPTPML